MAVQAAVLAAQKRAASGASTKNTNTGVVTPQLGATNQQLIDQNKTGVPAANQSNILKPIAPTPAVGQLVPSVNKPLTPLQNSIPVVHDNSSKPLPQQPSATTAEPVTSYDDMAKGQIQKEYDDIAKTGSDLGISTYSSIDQQFKDTIQRQREQKAAQEKQLALQKAGVVQDSEDNKKAITSAAEVQKSGLADNQEGFSSGSNRAASTQLQTAVAQKIARIDQEKEAAVASVDAAQKQLNDAELAGNTELAQKYRSTLASAKQQVQALEDEHIKTQMAVQQQQDAKINNLVSLGALDGASEETIQKLAASNGVDPDTLRAVADSKAYASASAAQKAQFERQNTALNTFKGLATEGIAIPNSLLLSMSESTGLPVDALMKFNDTSAAIMANKQLSNEEKAAQVQELGMKLDRQQRGILNADLEKVDYISQMYKNGASQEEIARTKAIMGIKDADDPMYRADLAYKEAQTAYEKSQTAENYANLQKTQLELMDMAGEAPGGYVPTKSLANITSSYSGGKLNIKCDTPMQCGEFVNRFWGLASGGSGGMPSSAAGKEALVTKNGVAAKELINNGQFFNIIKPGMAFVTKYGKTDHTGIVTAVYPDGRFDTMEANVGDNNPNTPDAPLPKTRSLKDANLVGFAYPPSGKVQFQGGGINGSNDFSKYVQEAKAKGLSSEEAKKYANEKVKDDLKNGANGDSSNDPKQIASNIMQGNIGLDLDSIKQDLRPAVAEELGKLKQSALKSGDTLGYLKASAGGKQLDATAVQGLGKAQNVLSQLPGLEETINNMDTGPITNIFTGNNPYDKKVALLKAQLQAIVPNLARGVYGEVGVLTDNDIKNYIATLPNNASTDDQKKALMDFTKKTISNSIENNLKNYAMAGYNVSGYTPILESLGGGSQKKSTKLFDAATNFIKNNFNTQSVDNNHWNYIDTTTSDDVLNQFS